MKYLELLKLKGTDTEKVKQFERAAAKASLQWESNLLETRSKLEQARDELQQLKSSTNLSAQAISDKMDEIEGYEKGLSRLEDLKQELF